MKILSVTAQKPDSTGSGVFLTELVKGFAGLGCDQAVVCGTVRQDTLPFGPEISLFPVYYDSPELPFPVCGMSDEMPYESTRYRDLDGRMTEQLLDAFRRKIREAVETFRPDVILCHHLYFLAALIRQMYPGIPVFGQCHGSDLRQMETNEWQREWIKSQIAGLDGIFALHEAQKRQICRVFDLPAQRVRVVGTGYNSDIFFRENRDSRNPEKIRCLFAGKLSEKKGIYSLLEALPYLRHPEKMEIYLAGGCSSEEELEHLRRMAQGAPCAVTFLGKLDQKGLAHQMNGCDVFVLPSFYEGLPLVLIEAMACGMNTICTDLLGIRPWLDQAVPEHRGVFVAPPQMRDTDEPIPSELPAFQRRLAEAMECVAALPKPDPEWVRHLSWTALCRKLREIFEDQEEKLCW